MAYKYKQLASYIENKIISGEIKENTKINSEMDLCKQFDVSRQTVRNAIASLVKGGYLYTVQGKGTFVRNKAACINKSYFCGFGTQLFKNYRIFPNIVAGINDKIKMEQYKLIIDETKDSIVGERKCLESFLLQNIGGLIMEPCKSALPSPNLDLYNKFIQKGIPIIFFNGFRREIDCSYVVVDDEQGGYQAAKHLLSLGHKRIYSFFKYDDQQGMNRWKGVMRAFIEANIPFDENSVFWFGSEDYFYLSQKSENDRFESAIRNAVEQCTAIIAYNDLIAEKILKVLEQLNLKVPDNISLISFDDTDLILDRKITSIEHPSYLMGNKIGESMLRLFKNPNLCIHEVLPCRLIIRNSVKKISS